MLQHPRLSKIVKISGHDLTVSSTTLSGGDYTIKLADDATVTLNGVLVEPQLLSPGDTIWVSRDNPVTLCVALMEILQASVPVPNPSK